MATVTMAVSGIRMDLSDDHFVAFKSSNIHRCIIYSCHLNLDSLNHLVTQTMLQSTGLETWDWSAAEFYAEMSESLSELFVKT